MPEEKPEAVAEEARVQEIATGGSDSASSRRFEDSSAAVRTQAASASVAEILARPRAGLRRASLNAFKRVRRHGWPWMLLSAALLAAQIAIFLSWAGAGEGLKPALTHLTVFAGVFLAPLALVFAWPVPAAAFLAGSIWFAWTLGGGGLWFMLATACAGLLLYLTAGQLAPLLGAAALGYILSAAGAAAGWTAFALSLPLLYWARLRVSVPVMAALWTWIASHVARRAAMMAAAEVIDWPRGSLVLWTACAMILAGALVWPSPRKRRLPPPVWPEK